MNKEMKITHHDGYSYFHVSGDKVYCLTDDEEWIEHYESIDELFKYRNIKEYNGEPLRYDFEPTEGGMCTDVNASGDYVKHTDYEIVSEEAKNGAEWFNSYQAIDEYIAGKLKDCDFVTSNTMPENNTIASINLLLKQRDKELIDTMRLTHKLITQCCNDGFVSEELFLNQASLARVLREVES